LKPQILKSNIVIRFPKRRITDYDCICDIFIYNEEFMFSDDDGLNIWNEKQADKAIIQVNEE
jgi:hypothetical protein